ncbi:MAG: long-chain-fatty-acid--CoA ligase [Gammaproteobacteria bacterium]|jgi:acyl-CoA synthetase (AMP-forming)/AMP-acid ligase II|nr:long-chain-fatty-acid--CoA ligase [Gammaproteobacteria bacterium]
MWLYSEIKTLGDIPRHYASQTPEKPALIDQTGATSWSALNERSNRIAHALLALGVTSGARVAFLGKNTARYFELLFGVNKAAAALLPLNWRLAVPEMAAIIEDADPIVLVADHEYAETARSIAKASRESCRTIILDNASPERSELDALMREAPATDPVIEINPWQTAILMYTSGTTGKPKGVQLSHQGTLFLRLCEHLETSFRYDADDVMLTVMPLFHAMGTSLSLQALYNGVPVAIYPMPEPGELLRLIARDRPTVLPLVPTVIQMLLNHPEAANADFSSVRVVIYAGSGIAPHTLTRALNEIKCDFIQFYGATETACGITFLRPADHNVRNETRLKSCGSTLPLIEIKVADADGNEVPVGTVGEFLIRSPSLTTGYFRQPEVTAAAFKEGWYRSGDGGYRDAEGYLYIVDRVKDMIVSGGENVYSTEVEQAIHRLPGVQMCAAVGLPDPKWGERVVAVIVKDPTADISPDQVISHCRNLIAGYKIPKQVEFVESLPITSSGKVMKRALREKLLRDEST